MEAQKFEQAEAVYRRDLLWNQNNGWSLYGLHQSLKEQGQETDAAEVFRQFEEKWQHADVTLQRSRV
jgi:Tfp pilus assembly protein PilF